MAETDVIRFTFSYTAEDQGRYVRFSRRGGSNPGAPAPKASRALLGWIVILLASITLFAIFSGDDTRIAAGPVVYKTPLWAFLALGAMAVITFLSVLVVIFVLRATRIKSLRAMKGQVQTVEFSHDNMLWEGPGYSARFRWSYYLGFEETPQAFHLSAWTNTVHVIPKRALTPQQADFVREVLRQHLGGSGGTPLPPPPSSSTSPTLTPTT